MSETKFTVDGKDAAEVAENYERDGFVIVPNVLTKVECRALKAEGLRVLAEKSGKNRTVYVGVAVASELYRELASHPRIVEVLEPIMPDGIMFMSDKFVFKSGEKTFGTPWHCDIAYWKNTRTKISVWIPLDDVNAGNGALKVLPGGHKTDWTHGDNGGTGEGKEFENVISSLSDDAPGQVIAEMKTGDALFFSDKLPHASTSNVDGSDRYAIISTYHAPAADDFFDVAFAARHVISTE